MVTIGKKIRILLQYKNMTIQDLNRLMGYDSPSGLYNKFKRDNFSEEDLQVICEKLNCQYEVTITDNDTGFKI